MTIKETPLEVPRPVPAVGSIQPTSKFLSSALLTSVTLLLSLFLFVANSVAQGTGNVLADDPRAHELTERAKDRMDSQRGPLTGATNQAKQLIEQVVKEGDQSIPDNLAFDNFQGATRQEVEATLSADKTKVTGDAFKQAQYWGHSYGDINSPPRVQPGFCRLDFKYRGSAQGYCKFCITIPYCGCFCIYADLVEYAFPSFKIDTSEQLYQSRYLPKDLIQGMLAENEETFYPIAAKETEYTNRQVLEAQLRLLRDPRHGDMGNINTPDADYSALREMAQKAVDQMQAGYSSRIRHAAADRERIYSRIIFEPANLETAGTKASYSVRARRSRGRWRHPRVSWSPGQGKWWIPHIPKAHFFGTDLPGGYIYSKALSASAALNPGRLTNFLFGNQGSCVRLNINTGKTPDILSKYAIGSPNRDDCLADVGATFPYTDYGMLYISDRTYAGAKEGYDLFKLLFDDAGGAFGPPGRHFSAERHSDIARVDRFKVIYDPVFERENPNVGTFDQLARENTEYTNSQVKKIRSGAEKTFEAYTLFKGCWGFKGVGEEFWWAGSCGSGIYESQTMMPEGITRLRLH